MIWLIVRYIHPYIYIYYRSIVLFLLFRYLIHPKIRSRTTLWGSRYLSSWGAIARCFLHASSLSKTITSHTVSPSFFLSRGFFSGKRKSETRRNEVWRRIWSHYELSLEGNSIEELRKNFPRRSPKCYYWFLFLGGFPVNLIVTTCLSSVVG